MDGFDSHGGSGSLHISTDVIEKIVHHAALEVEGVKGVAPALTGARMLLEKISPTKAIVVELKNDVADVEVSLVVAYGVKIPDLCEEVQKNVKTSVQNMTNISVARVDVVIVGVVPDNEPAE